MVNILQNYFVFEFQNYRAVVSSTFDDIDRDTFEYIPAHSDIRGGKWLIYEKYVAEVSIGICLFDGI